MAMSPLMRVPLAMSAMAMPMPVAVSVMAMPMPEAMSVMAPLALHHLTLSNILVVLVTHSVAPSAPMCLLFCQGLHKPVHSQGLATSSLCIRKA